MDTTAKEIHDRLLAKKPAGANHDEATCCFCVATAAETATAREEHMGDKPTFTAEEVEVKVAAAVTAATDKLQAQLDELTKAQQTSEVAAQIQAVRDELQAKLDEVQQELDTTILRAEKAEKEIEDTKTYLDAEAAREQEEAERASKREGRLAQAKELGFSDETIADKADRWAEMSEETWETFVESCRDIKPAAATTEPGKAGEGKAKEGELPKETALAATREPGAEGAGGEGSNVSVLRQYRRTRGRPARAAADA